LYHHEDIQFKLDGESLEVIDVSLSKLYRTFIRARRCCLWQLYPEWYSWER